jgi:hypothetical protein
MAGNSPLAGSRLVCQRAGAAAWAALRMNSWIGLLLQDQLFDYGVGAF